MDGMTCQVSFIGATTLGHFEKSKVLHSDVIQFIFQCWLWKHMVLKVLTKLSKLIKLTVSDSIEAIILTMHKEDFSMAGMFSSMIPSY